MTGSQRTPDEFDQDAFEAAFAAEFGEAVEPERDGGTGYEGREEKDATGTGQPGEQAGAGIDAGDLDGAEGEGATKRTVLALVMTPIASAQVLAALCAVGKIDATVIASKHGALAAKLIAPSEQSEMDELLGNDPGPAQELATAISGNAHLGVVLLTARLGQSEEGTSGKITARAYESGQPGEAVAPGLMLARADDVVENLLTGVLSLEDAPGRIEPGSISAWQAAKIMAKQLKKRKK